MIQTSLCAFILYNFILYCTCCSDTGGKVPESCVFTFICGVGAILSKSSQCTNIIWYSSLYTVTVASTSIVSMTLNAWTLVSDRYFCLGMLVALRSWFYNNYYYCEI